MGDGGEGGGEGGGGGLSSSQTRRQTARQAPLRHHVAMPLSSSILSLAGSAAAGVCAFGEASATGEPRRSRTHSASTLTLKYWSRPWKGCTCAS